MHSSAKNLAQIRQKSTGCKKIIQNGYKGKKLNQKKGIKGQLGPLMGSGGQTVHHCPSPAILLCFSLPSHKIKNIEGNLSKIIKNSSEMCGK